MQIDRRERGTSPRTDQVHFEMVATYDISFKKHFLPTGRCPRTANMCHEISLSVSSGMGVPCGQEFMTVPDSLWSSSSTTPEIVL
ncbi:hypothetical protein Taro_019812 [Colocasia esculenta]|uniref:Uncharacterized protein n=1 Tax=Colocasia esculenta TaxID=4460 RepID=A0A843UUT8_COLES|nr:hypothetical protein [Colocasia esculenta]